jgi:hypothetical protein
MNSTRNAKHIQKFTAYESHIDIIDIICSIYRRYQGGCSRLDMWHAWGRGEMFTGFWLGGPKARDHWEDLDVVGRIALRWTLGK